MSDERLRELERLAATGEREAVRALHRERLRRGLLRLGLERTVGVPAEVVPAAEEDRRWWSPTVDSLRTLSDGDLLVGGTGRLERWSRAAGSFSHSFDGYGEPERVTVSPDGRRVLATRVNGTHETLFGIWDLATRELERELRFPGMTRSVAWLEGRLVACSFTEPSLTVYSEASGAELRRLSLRSVPAGLVSLPGGSLVVVGTNPPRLLCTGTSVEIRALASVGTTRTLTRTPDGRHVVLGTDEGNVEVWDVESGALHFTRTHGEPVWTVSVDGRGERALALDPTGFTVWRLGDGEEVARFATEAAACATFSADGLRAYTGDEHGNLHTWVLPA